MELKDIDGLLRGEAHDTISIEDWKLHTGYENFEETDNVIEWFWKLVDGMDEERRHHLLYFWTARMYLPVGGFAELPERLTITRQFGIGDTLPKSQTCSSELQIREYSRIEDMEADFIYITTNYVGFGLI
ncbi:hypothetical protein Bca4012_014341 [Brassica carinata]|uniref:HECT-type E3 ubiquitin transferase n=1 Tax=Brassica carinata TaxID=52824 RepID=A0A8X7TLY7_BRACI|nr:hypothetical protein Bca52824_093226 [Brassica carinata]